MFILFKIQSNIPVIFITKYQYIPSTHTHLYINTHLDELAIVVKIKVNQIVQAPIYSVLTRPYTHIITNLLYQSLYISGLVNGLKHSKCNDIEK